MAKTKQTKTDRFAKLREQAERVLQAALALEAWPVPTEAHFEAQDLFFGAMELQRRDAVIKRCIKAVQMNPNAPDPLSYLAEFVEENPENLALIYEQIVRAGERDLGKEVFKEAKGYFWGMLETRPYMRARHRLAQLLSEAGNLAGATKHYQAMLELNPNDNQGVRYTLLGLLLETEKLSTARKLYRQYEDEYSAVWHWGRVLLDFLEQGPEAAKPALGKARENNRHAEAYLAGWRPMPKKLPPFYQPGDESEAIVCNLEIGAAWRKYPKALSWLEEQS